MMAYKFGGGAFLLPYVLSLLFAAIPIAALEFALGQIFQCDHARMMQRLSPAAAGLGWAAVVGTFMLTHFYNMLLAYVCMYLLSSLPSPQPWSLPNASASTFFVDDVLERSPRIGQLEGPVPALVGCYAFVWAVVCVGVCRGAQSIGWASKLLLPLPFFILVCFLIRGAHSRVTHTASDWQRA